MADVRYAPGSWVAVAGSRVWLLAEVDSAAPVVSRWWELVLDGRSVDELLGAIIHEGFRTVGNFAIVHRGDRTIRVVVRGKAGVEVVTTSGDTELVADASVATWLDAHFDGPPARLRLMAEHENDTPERLPLAQGVVLAATIRVDLAPAPVVAVAPAAAPAAVEEVAPRQIEEPAEPEPDPEPGFDHLFGATQHARDTNSVAQDCDSQSPRYDSREPQPEGPASRNVQQASVEPEQRPEPVKGSADTLPVAVVEDGGIILDIFSGQPAPVPASAPTVSARDIGMTVKRQPRQAAATETPTVFAVRCPAGHLNPEDAPACRVCEAPITDRESLVAPRPVLGALRLSTGDLITLDRGVIMGREPQPPDGDDRSWHRVKLPSPGNDISRNHVEVKAGDWQVFVTDLGSTNGTEVTVPGMAVWPLQPNEPVPIEPGTVVSLAGEISFTFEVIA